MAAIVIADKNHSLHILLSITLIHCVLGLDCWSTVLFNVCFAHLEKLITSPNLKVSICTKYFNRRLLCNDPKGLKIYSKFIGINLSGESIRSSVIFLEIVQKELRMNGEIAKSAVGRSDIERQMTTSMPCPIAM